MAAADLKSQGDSPGGPSAMTMYTMLSAQPLTNWIIRGAIAPLMQFIVADLGFSLREKALLLGAFYPGYLITQIPAGFLIQKYGGKIMLTINMVGTGLCTALLPITLQSARPVLLTWITLTVSGMFQGSLIPAHQDLKRHWLPVGAGRAVANRIIGIGLTLNSLLATSMTPFLASRFGWRSVFFQYGVGSLLFAALWNFVAADSPAPSKPSALPPGAAKLGTTETQPPDSAKTTEKVFEWRIFTVPAVLVAIGCKGMSGLPEYCLTQWLPTEFSERFGSTDTEIALFRVWVTPLMFAVDWIVGFGEEVLMARGVAELSIRRWFSTVGATIEAAALTGFALARSAPQAAAANAVVCAAYTLHHGGWSANLLEVGGKDTPVMNAFSNILNNFPGFWIPPLGLLVKQRTGSTLPLFAGCAVANWMMNLLFARFVSMEDGRTILARRDAIAAAKAETEVLAAAPTTEPKGTQGPRGPRAVVVAGPSGVGKGTLISMLMEDMRGKFGFSVSHATRVSRPGEVDGVNYHFVAVPEMEAAIKNGEFIEYAKVHGNYYGTSKKSVADVCEQGKRPLFLFIKPTSEEVLEARLRGRGTEDDISLARRMATAKTELAFEASVEGREIFTQAIVNDDLDVAYNEFKAAICEAHGL